MKLLNTLNPLNPLFIIKLKIKGNKMLKLKNLQAEIEILSKGITEYVVAYSGAAEEDTIVFDGGLSWLDIHLEGYETITVYRSTDIPELLRRLTPTCDVANIPKTFAEFEDRKKLMQNKKRIAVRAYLAIKYVMGCDNPIGLESQ